MHAPDAKDDKVEWANMGVRRKDSAIGVRRPVNAMASERGSSGTRIGREVDIPPDHRQLFTSQR
jgi:hypothetical protein